VAIVSEGAASGTVARSPRLGAGGGVVRPPRHAPGVLDVGDRPQRAGTGIAERAREPEQGQGQVDGPEVRDAVDREALTVPAPERADDPVQAGLADRS
jgi:hypothetical protein